MGHWFVSVFIVLDVFCSYLISQTQIYAAYWVLLSNIDEIRQIIFVSNGNFRKDSIQHRTPECDIHRNDILFEEKNSWLQERNVKGNH